MRTRTELAAVWPPTANAGREAGHEPMSPLKAIRAKCHDCSYFQPSEIRLCEAVNCALWPFRAGKNPWRSPSGKKGVIPAGFLRARVGAPTPTFDSPAEKTPSFVEDFEQGEAIGEQSAPQGSAP
jgi:hypothetical protein